MHHWCSRKTREGLTTVMRPGQIQRALQLPPPAQALGGRNTKRREEARRAGKGGAGSAVVGWGSPTEPAGGRSSALPSSRCGERPRSRALSREGDLQGPDRFDKMHILLMTLSLKIYLPCTMSSKINIQEIVYPCTG